MPVLGHLLLAFAAIATIWLLSGLLIDATDRVAKRYQKPGFAVAFFILGILTSISELSVATSATLEKVPQVSAGNLLGASTVIFLLIIPLLAALGNGIPMQNGLRKQNLVLLLLLVLLPSLLAIDGSVSMMEGVVMLMGYVILILRLHKKRPAGEVAKDALERTQFELVGGRRATAVDTMKIAVSAVLIFVAGNILVDESVFLAAWMGVPVSFIGLMLLSIGTNIPELVIAIRCVVGKHKDIAFGDYLGSAAFNTAIFGFLPLANGGFVLERSEAIVNSAVLGVGLVLFFLFGLTKNIISRRESLILLFMYALFLVLQVGNAIRIADPSLPNDALKRAAPLSQMSSHP